MSHHPLTHGIDFCFNAADPGSASPEGHYRLGCGCIQRHQESATWKKALDPAGIMMRERSVVLTFYDMSQTVTSIDFVSIAMQPDPDGAGRAGNSSPFSLSDQEVLLTGQTLSSAGPQPSRGCGDGSDAPLGNMFPAGTYVLRETGDYLMSVALRVTDAAGNLIELRGDARISVENG